MFGSYESLANMDRILKLSPDKTLEEFNNKFDTIRKIDLSIISSIHKKSTSSEHQHQVIERVVSGLLEKSVVSTNYPGESVVVYKHTIRFIGTTIDEYCGIPDLILNHIRLPIYPSESDRKMYICKCLLLLECGADKVENTYDSTHQSVSYNGSLWLCTMSAIFFIVFIVMGSVFIRNCNYKMVALSVISAVIALALLSFEFMYYKKSRLSMKKYKIWLNSNKNAYIDFYIDVFMEKYKNNIFIIGIPTLVLLSILFITVVIK